MAGPEIVLVHGNQSLNTVYVHEQRSDDFLAKMGSVLGAKSGDAVCFGHTHLPFHRTVGGVHFVNAGSVGRSKDGDPRASYVLIDASCDEMHVDFVRVECDVERIAQAIMVSGLPSDLAEFVRSGGSKKRT